MHLSRDYRQPFWHGFFHASLVMIYTLFLALLLRQLDVLFSGGIAPVIRLAFQLFLLIFSVAVCAGLIFYEPVKKLLHFHFKAATVMLLSTFGWLFIYLIIFIYGLLLTAPSLS